MHPDLEGAAAALRVARERRLQIAPVASTFGLESIDQAYAVATRNAEARVAAGSRVTGKKIGLTAASVQKQLGVDQPDFGILFDDMEHLDHDVVATARLMQPKVEGEIAFVVGRDLRGGHSPSWGEFVAALDHALPAIEIVDSAITDWKIGILDTVADNASAALYVLGEQPVSLGAFPLADLGMTLALNNTIVSEGRGSACLGHPLRAAHWLACEMARRGEPLRAGEIILSGALGPMVPVTSGDAIAVDFGAFGRVACQFA